MRNIDAALELCRKTADYPPEARFKWNTEVLWAVDSYLHKAPPEKQRQLIDAVRAGQIELDALYGNELTGLCRPEELLRLCECAQQLAKRLRREDRLGDDQRRAGLHLGHRARAVAGRRQVFLARNQFHATAHAPSPLGKTSPSTGSVPTAGKKSSAGCPTRATRLGIHPSDSSWSETCRNAWPNWNKMGYPYDIVQLRWNVGGDNGPPDATLPDVVKTGTRSTHIPSWSSPPPASRSGSSRSDTPTRFPCSAAILRRTGRTGPVRRPAKPRSTAPPPSGSCRPKSL